MQQRSLSGPHRDHPHRMAKLRLVLTGVSKACGSLGGCRNLTDGEPEFGAATLTGQGASPQRSHSRGTEPIWPTEVLLPDHDQSGKQQVRYLLAAKLIWGSNLELDNTVLLRTNIKAP